jgi:hypothetical protein
MSKRTGIALAAATLVAALAACTSVPLPPAAPDESRAVLEKALTNVERLPASTASADAKPALAKMGPKITMNYAGEGKTLLKQVTAARGMKFSVRGPQPYLPLFVIVDLKDVTLEEFLSDVGAQFGQRATLALTDDAIEIRYRDH